MKHENSSAGAIAKSFYYFEEFTDKPVIELLVISIFKSWLKSIDFMEVSTENRVE